MTLSPLAANAQFYPKDLSDEMYHEFIDLERVQDADIGIRRADSLAALCSAKGDYESEMFFRSQTIQNYLRLREYDKLKVLTQKMRKDASKLPENGDYWHFWSHYIDVMALIDEGKIFDVIDMLSKMRDESEKAQSKYGIFITTFSIGEVYRNRDDIGMAGENYLKAYEFQKQNLPNLNPALICGYLAEYYRRKSGRTPEDIDRSKELVNEGLACATDDRIRAKLLSEKAMLQYYDKNRKHFLDTYRECDSLYSIIGTSPEFMQVQYRKFILDKDYNSAMNIANLLPSEYDRHIARYVILKAKGEYENALQYYEKANHALNLIREQERRGDLSEISAKLGNYQLIIENSELEKERTQAQNARSRYFNTALTFICIAAIIVLIGVIMFNRRIKRTNIMLEQSNNQLTLARNKAQESEKIKTMFIQNMSHEIRTPLNAIVGFSNLLTYDDNEYSKDELNDFRKLINDNCRALTNLVDNVLTISDYESGKFVFEYNKTPVNEMCIAAIDSVRATVRDGVDLLFTSNVADDFIINTDRLHVIQILTNILANACKYTVVGEIVLEAEKLDGKHLRLSVADTGPGIPEDKKDDIFRRFTKLDNFSQGSGLGLSISKLIADQLSARLYLDTSYIIGARFVLDLPL